ncbi:acyl-peptide hydrolase [Alteromonas sp. KC3]|uniref:S9 family peptidase n=1 Tax=unclassified Alteromonas TaxID=2614992 RepID=UPI00192330E6|nr:MULTISPECIES: S9 family peptidase [unclassified Alteromonas]BCO17581.1 acyl-peptide hydrolase [Alteromonas sp. KC3]BCO21559.1 acyl-peptide hydrolase [Alteromonas sp. KC14]
MLTSRHVSRWRLVKSSIALSLLLSTSSAVNALQDADNTSSPSTTVNPLQYEDTFNLEFVANPQFISDDTVIYSRQSMDIMTDGRQSRLWQVNIKSGEHRPFIADDVSLSQATLSPNGNYIAYTKSVKGQAQLHLYYLDTRQSVRLTNLTETPRQITWSNDSKTLAFTLFDEAPQKPIFTGMPAKPKGANWAETATYIDATQYRGDGRGYLREGYDQIFVLPIEGGTPRKLTSGNFPSGGTLSFSNDNEWVYFATPHREDYALHPLVSDIYKVNIETLDIEQVTAIEGPEGRPSISPDGKYLAFTQLNDRKLSYQNSDLVVMELASGEVTRLTTSLDRSLGQFVWRQNSRGLIFSYLDNGETKLAAVNLNGDVKPLDIAIGGQAFGRPYTSGDFAISKKGDIVYTTASRTMPGDLALYRKGKQDGVLTHLNDDALGHKTLAKVEDLTVISSYDEREIDAWVAYPPGFDTTKTYPLILEIHGGPHAAYGPHFAMEIQLMAAKGYVVVWSNPRGSSSYGEDFGNLIHHNYPSNDFNDLMDVVDAVVAKGNIDTENLFITGGSGGGVLTAWSIGMTDRFAAAVVAKPVINWVSFALTADAYPYFSQYWMADKPWNIADKLWKRSPLSLVGNVTTPTMLLTGEADHRTPISESEQYYQALKLQGVDAAMVRIPGASHGIASRPSRLIQKVGNILAWFERYATSPKEND